MVIKRALEIEGMALLKCEPTPPPSQKKGDFFESFKQFLEFSI